MGAKTKPQDTLSAGDLGLGESDLGEAGAKTTVLELSPPPSRGDQVKIEWRSVQLRPELELEGATTDSVLDGLLATVPAPR